MNVVQGEEEPQGKKEKEHVTISSKSFTSFRISNQPTHVLLAHFQNQFDGSRASQWYHVISAQAFMN